MLPEINHWVQTGKMVKGKIVSLFSKNMMACDAEYAVMAIEEHNIVCLMRN